MSSAGTRDAAGAQTSSRPPFVAVLEADALVVDSLLPVLDRFGISIETFRALALLHERPDGATVGEVGRRTGTRAASTSRLVDRLVSENLVYRRADTLDRRRIVMHLSQTGAERWQELVEAFADPS